MRYFFDFDRTVFDTPAFKRDFAHRPRLSELAQQTKEIVQELFSPNRTLSFRRIVARTLGTYASHRRLGFRQAELKEYLYPDAVAFFEKYGADCVIVTYGVRAFITAKVANALGEFPLADIVYTHRKKGRTIRRLMEGQEGPFVFVDDAHFQLESVHEVNPTVEVIEIRRDGNAGDGRWPVIRSFDELRVPERAAIDLSSARIAVIVNTASGSADAAAPDVIRTILKEAGAAEPRVWAGDASIMDDAFVGVKAYAPRVLIVLGGDGTIRNAAEASAGSGVLLVPLPGGTMNMLPKALYGTRSWQDALRDTLAHPCEKTVSGGEADGRRFFIAAIAGAPALWTHAREALRQGDLGAAVDKGADALARMATEHVRYVFSGDVAGETEAVTAICPLISDAMHESDRSLEAAAISVKGAGEVLGLASSAAFGAWRDDARVLVTRTREIALSADTEIPLILDGEPVDAGKSVLIRFVPEAFRTLVPSGSA